MSSDLIALYLVVLAMALLLCAIGLGLLLVYREVKRLNKLLEAVYERT